MKRKVDRSNPWGLTELEARVASAVIERGDHTGAAALMGVDVRTVDNAMVRARRKIGVDSNLQLAARWAVWRKTAEGRPRTAWACPACAGLGFTVARPA